MNLVQARRIVAAEDISDPALALEAMAAVLRFYGISDAPLVSIAETLEHVAKSLAQHPNQAKLPG